MALAPNPPLDILGGTRYPTASNRYHSRLTGLYYNGYCLSPEAAEAAFGECFRQMARELKKELNDD